MTNSADFKVVAGLLALSLAVGGAGVSFPRLAMLLQILALAGAGYFLVTRRSWRLQRLTSLALVVLGGILLLPLLQLIPLPPAIWTQLPGRELPQQLDQILGSSRWRPLSLDVEGTIRSFLALLPAAVVFVGSLFLSPSERVRLLWVVLPFAVLSAILGIVQLASGGAVTPYGSTHQGYPIGLFVNRNHNASFLLIGMVVTGALAGMQIRQGKARAPWVVGSLSIIIILAVVTVGTTSRMALILLPLCIAAALLLLFMRGSASRLILGSVAVVAAVTSLIFASGGFDQTFERFSGLRDARFDYWTDIQWALQYYGLAGTGFGTFIPVYMSAESLDAVNPRTTNHAHNDYLELLLEGGLPAVVLFFVFIAVMALGLVHSVKSSRGAGQSLATAAAAVGILVLLTSSLVDYPLRMPALSVVLAVFCALLLPASPAQPARAEGVATAKAARIESTISSMRLKSAWLVAISIVLTLSSVLALQAGMSAHQLSYGRYEAAASWAPWSTEAHERFSTQALLGNQLQKALSHASFALKFSPISAPAIRTAGLVSLTQGRRGVGNQLMQLAVGLGWRDPLTQLWAIDAAKASREPEKAVQRAEALFRQNKLAAPAIVQLLNARTEANILPQLADRLAQRPPWRSRFFKASGQLRSAQSEAWFSLVQLLKQSDAPVTVREGQPFIDSLLRAGRVEDAQRLWRELRGSRIVSNGDFEEGGSRGKASSPTDWRVLKQNRSRVTVGNPEFDPKTRALHISGEPDGPLLSQSLMLAPGRYALSFNARGSSPRGDGVRWELRCGRSNVLKRVEIEVPPSSGWQQVDSIFFAVPPGDCPLQRLILRGSSAKAPDDLWLDDIQLRFMDD